MPDGNLVGAQRLPRSFGSDSWQELQDPSMSLKSRGKAMIRIGLAIVALMSALATPGLAQDRPDNADGRFTLHRTDEGFLRLDGRSGQVSLCLKRSAGWECQPVP